MKSAFNKKKFSIIVMCTILLAELKSCNSDWDLNPQSN